VSPPPDLILIGGVEAEAGAVAELQRVLGVPIEEHLRVGLARQIERPARVGRRVWIRSWLRWLTAPVA
jgi:hypothetical protein